MGYQPQKLEKLFDKWAEKHAKKLSTEAPYEVQHEAPYGKFVRDGIINPEKWAIQEPKICFVMLKLAATMTPKNSLKVTTWLQNGMKKVLSQS